MAKTISKYNRFLSDHRRNKKPPKSTYYLHQKKLKNKPLKLKNNIMLLNGSIDNSISHEDNNNINGLLELPFVEQEHEMLNSATTSVSNIIEEEDVTQKNLSIVYDTNLFNIDLNEIDADEQVNYICMSLLTLFFAGNLTQTALQLITEYVQMFTKIKVPKTLNSLLNNANIKPFEYSKQNYCQICCKEVTLDRPHQRQCSICRNR